MVPEVLIITSSPNSVADLQRGLADCGYYVSVAEWKANLWVQQARESQANVIVLYVPDLDDLKEEDVRLLPRDSAHSPYLVVVGSGDLRQRVRCLNAGADACMLPSIGATEMVARLVALMRTIARGRALVYDEGDLSLDLARKVATYRGYRLDLSPYEFKVLRELALRVMESRCQSTGTSEDPRLTEALGRLRGFADRIERRGRHRIQPLGTVDKKEGP